MAPPERGGHTYRGCRPYENGHLFNAKLAEKRHISLKRYKSILKSILYYHVKVNTAGRVEAPWQAKLVMNLKQHG